MAIAHAVWLGDGFALWGERPSPWAGARRGGRHPGAAAAEELAEAAEALCGGAGARAAAKAVPGEVVLRLPGRDGVPVRSGPSAEDVGSGDGVRLGEWTVPALLFDRAAATAFAAELAALAPTGGAAHDVVVGDDLAHLGAVAALARRLVAEGQVLPGLVGGTEADAGFAARWEPVVAGRWSAPYRALVAAAPPALRAAPSAPDGGAAVVAAALGVFTDELVRERLSGGAAAVPPGGGLPGRWLAALVDAEGRVDGAAPAEAAELSARLDRWRGEALRAHERVRLVFRLAAPDEDADDDPAARAEPAPGAADAGPGARDPAGGAAPWRIEFWVGSAHDPSLMLPLRRLWLGEGLPWLPGDVDEQVVAGLRRAARRYPAIGRVLAHPAPDQVSTDAAGASRFIRDHAPALRAAGFDVLLPRWADQRGIGVVLVAEDAEGAAPASAGSGIGAAQLIDFRYEAAIGDQVLDAAELQELARLKTPLVRLRGQWASLDERQLDAVLDFIRRQGHGRVRVAEVLRAAAASEPAEGVSLTGVRAGGVVGDLLSGALERRVEPLPAPEGFTGRLRPYQERGASWLRFLGGLGLGAVLADDMGLGKTVQLLAVLAAERRAAEPSPGPTLLICPVSLIGNWRREAERFTPGLRVHAHHGPSRPHGNELAALLGRTDLVITTYGVVLRDADELAAMPWHRVVCDEAQAIKNAGSRTARAVRALPAANRIALTGTPVENNLGELWALLEFANPGLLGGAAAFRGAIADRIERDGDAEATALLKRATGPFILRRLKTDRSIISDLPDKHEMKTWCQLTVEQATLYQACVNDFEQRLREAEGMQRKGLILATFTRLKQVCNHPAHLLGDGSRLTGRSGKLERLEELLAEALGGGDKALCFTQYTAFGDRLAPYLAERLGRPVLWLHGGVPRARREEMVAEFQSSPEPMVFLLSLKAAGTGLNLTAANHVVHLDRWWNPAVENQATDRAFRIGQRRDVQVRKLICISTLEERIDALIERKQALAESVVGTGEDWLTELSTAELREIVQLAPDAVVA
ncbi:DEAD/DEAH box helicase [Allonocardiopsis opalescens]|uniref:SNF2 family DNA or RNA helicase n=1 Tax=Allonocardiopsis opalescens TaxID=1144618 RepID=A0A2T0PXN2_9ACTN|nr:DEAD/DEAH box helicase [Allonocardiopsis opalescens]PRX96283.1 SNF2 family DNA or RNA helicase [Allonocardiopsis opalescens]